MIKEPRVSVIIPNRDRVEELGRALKALDFQTYRNFETIVVSNQPDVLKSRFEEIKRVHLVRFCEANISAVRNVGIGQAAGEIIAFLDDDAVPEPKWLARLIAPFENPQVGSVGGLVRGRNGVSYQWGPQEVDCFGNDWPIPIGRDWIKEPTRSERVLKTVGTNCAFRAEPLREIGFDQAYKFFLDETDLNWRLSKLGWKSVIVPDAEVHHGYASSSYRTSERVPKTLKEIGASKAYFCNRFGNSKFVWQELDGFRASQKIRLVRLMELGLLTSGMFEDLLDSLEEGLIEGMDRKRGAPKLPDTSKPFQVFQQSKCHEFPTLITAGLFSRRGAHSKARALAQKGELVTVFDFSYTAQMLTVRFKNEGYWLHRGGVFGCTERNERLFKPRKMLQRIKNEAIRIAPQRDVGII